MSRARLALASLPVAVLLAPATSPACAVCFAGSDESNLAFILSTIFLSLLPLGLIGGVVGWLVLRVRRQSRAQALSRASVRP